MKPLSLITLLIAAVAAITLTVMATSVKAESVDGDASVIQAVYPPDVSPAPATRHARSAGSCPQYDAIITREARKHANPMRLRALAHAVMYAESRCRPSAVSRAGARGLMQIMPRTARSMGYRGNRRGMHNVRVNINLGVRYLADSVRRYGYNVRTIAISYNAGHGRVHSRRLPRETRNYIVIVKRNLRRQNLSAVRPSQSWDI